MSISSSTTSKGGRRQRRPTHPGQVIQSGLEALEKSPYEAAAAMGASRQALSLVIQGKRGIGAELAIRYATYAGTGAGGARLLLEMQADVDLWDAEHAIASDLKAIEPAARPRRPSRGRGGAQAERARNR